MRLYYASSSAKGGAGGSGYVLTETSYIPQDYALDPSVYHMTDPITANGATTAPQYTSNASITVLDIQSPVLCRDTDGFKYYDPTETTWRLIEPQPTYLTPSTFTDHPSSFFINDIGLRDEYELYVCDETEMIESVSLTIVPDTHMIGYKFDSSQRITDIELDMDTYDPNEFSVTVHPAERWDDNHMIINIEVDKLRDNQESFRIYSARIKTVGNLYGAHKYINPDGKRDYYVVDEKTGEVVHERRKFEYRDPEDYRDETGQIMTAQWLLPVGKANSLMIKYRPEVLDANVDSIYCTCMVEYHRMIYVATLVRFNSDNNQIYLVIKSLNFMTGEIKPLHKILWSTIAQVATQYNMGSILVDDTYFWISIYGNSSATQMIRINRETGASVRTPTSISSYFVTCGRMCWLSSTEILIYTANALLKYDTIANEWKKMVDVPTPSAQPDSIAYGKSLILIHRSPYLYIVDRATWTLTSISFDGSCRICYDEDHEKFYIVSRAALRSFDEKTRTLGDSITIPTIASLSDIVYSNNALLITGLNETRAIVYRINDGVYNLIFLPWTTTTYTSYPSFQTLGFKGYFLFMYRSMMVINYSGTYKYNMGYKYNQLIALYNAANAEHIICDPRFFHLNDTDVSYSNGVVTYNMSLYNSSHIAYTTIHKSDYKYLQNVNYNMKSQTDDGE